MDDDSTKAPLAAWLAMGLFGLMGAALSGLSACWGGTVMGLENGGYGWQYIPFAFGGWALGCFAAIGMMVVWRAGKLSGMAASFGALLIPPVLAFLFGLILFPTLVRNNEIRAAEGGTSTAQYHALYQRLRDDPEVALREEWYSASDERFRVFQDSLKDEEIPYSLELLRRIYGAAPAMRGSVFSHPACDREFLAVHFEEAEAMAVSINYEMLAAIVSNPNTPIEMVEKVARSKTLPMGVLVPARAALKKRTGVVVEE